MIDRIKTDIEFRNKVIRVALIALVFLIAVIVMVFVTDDGKNITVSKTKNGVIVKDVIPADTTAIIDDKEAIFRENASYNRKQNSALDLVNNEADFGLNEKEVKQKEQVKEQEVDDYMTKRRNQIAKNQQIASANRRKRYSGRIDNSPKRNNYANKKTSKKKKKTPEQEQEEYIKRLIAFRNTSIDGNTSSIQQNTSVSTNENSVQIRAVIYFDQFVLPGERARLILPKEVVLGNKRYPKGTDIYANVSISKSRVLLDIENINHTPVELVAKDIEDGNIGVYNDQAGKLWREYQQDLQQDLVSQLGNDIRTQANSNLLAGAVTSFSSFFAKKKYTERERVLLLNDHEVILTIKPQNYDEIEKIQL